MYSTLFLLASSLVAKAVADDDYTVLGSVIFGRHNDREAKPANYLTPLGAQNQYKTGQFYRKRYFGLDSSNNKVDVETAISGLDEDGLYVKGQIYTETAENNVLMTSHYAFLQGLYPPTDIDSDSELYNQTLVEVANGTDIENPLNGYQYVQTTIQQDETDDYIWVKGDENCPSSTKAISKVEKSSHFYTPGNASLEFFQSLYSIDFIKETFDYDDLTFLNSMNIYDEVTVNKIHNGTVAKQINESIYTQIQYWSDLYQWTLSDQTINSNLTIGGQTLISRVYQKLNTTLHTSTPYLTYLTGSFNTMYQLSSVISLYTQDNRFKTMPSYGATYVFELLSDSSDDKYVRFSFKNGTDEMGDEITSYAMFNSSDIVMSWNDFESYVEEVSLSKVSSWCTACGYDALDSDSVIGMCVPSSDLYEAAVTLESKGVDLNSIESSDGSSSSLTLADAGGIGAGTTIGVFLILGGLFYLYKKLSSKSKKSPVLPVTNNDTDDASTNIGSVNKE